MTKITHQLLSPTNSAQIKVEHIILENMVGYPIETCWKVTKNNVTKSQYFPTIDEMQDALENFWAEHN